MEKGHRGKFLRGSTQATPARREFLLRTPDCVKEKKPKFWQSLTWPGRARSIDSAWDNADTQNSSRRWQGTVTSCVDDRSTTKAMQRLRSSTSVILRQYGLVHNLFSVACQNFAHGRQPAPIYSNIVRHTDCDQSALATPHKTQHRLQISKAKKIAPTSKPVKQKRKQQHLSELTCWIVKP